MIVAWHEVPVEFGHSQAVALEEAENILTPGAKAGQPMLATLPLAH
jgi:hypothetical protein